MRFRTLAPAKVNLVLRVGPLRPDGYHDILSLFAPLDLADRVDVTISPGPGPVTCRVPGHPALDGESNLAARAALAFRARFGVERGIAIRIAKRIPVVAGLGGGSSDAAAVLRVLARAFHVTDTRALSAVGLAVGSDVPFFLGRGPAWARGRGEKLAPADVPVRHLVLVYPEDPALAIRASEAYRWLDADRAAARARVPGLNRPRGPWRDTLAGNDLEAPSLARRPTVATLRGLLVGQGATSSIMSGSGPTVFGVFPSRGAAGRAARSIAKEDAGESPVRIIVARTMRRQPGVTPWRSPRSASSP